MHITALLTCFNRREKTESCLRHLFEARLHYLAAHPDNPFTLTIHLTDDGCTDHTADAVLTLCRQYSILPHVIQGNGSLYWAGGMRKAWRAALADSQHYDFYLLLNDDTDVLPDVFDHLFRCHQHALHTDHRSGIYSGITASRTDTTHITYGGDIYLTPAKTITRRLTPTGSPQLADIITANILLVPSDVVDEIGIFYDGYIHSGADNDYSVTAHRHGIHSYVTPAVCGVCDDDHTYDEGECRLLMQMSLAERRRYVNSPTRSDSDYLLLMRRTIPKKYPISWLMRKLRLYCPSLYYKLNQLRGYYNS